MGQAAPGRMDCTALCSSDLGSCQQPLLNLARSSVAPKSPDRNRCRDVLSFLLVKKIARPFFSTDGCELVLTILAFSIFILNYFSIFLHGATLSTASRKVNNRKAKKLKVNVEF